VLTNKPLTVFFCHLALHDLESWQIARPGTRQWLKIINRETKKEASQQTKSYGPSSLGVNQPKPESDHVPQCLCRGIKSAVFCLHQCFRTFGQRTAGWAVDLP